MKRIITYLSAMLCAVLVSCAPVCDGELPPIGVTSSGGYYAFDSSVSCVEEGAERILGMGAGVIKLWLSDQSMRVNPYHTDWNRYRIRNCIDVLESDYYKATLSKDFSTVVLVTHTFDLEQEEPNVNWWDGMEREEILRVEREMYDVATYLMTAYRGSGRIFILQNWEGDNMLGSNGWRYDASSGLYYRPGHETDAPEDDSAFRIREKGLLEWFNARQRGVDLAVADMEGRTDVIVRHVLEVNFTYVDPGDAPYPYADSPILIQRIVPYTDCDLYSYSCWSAGVLSRAWTMKERLETVGRSIGETYIDSGDGMEKPRRPLGPRQRSRLMLGEYGGPERYQASATGGWAPVLTYETDRTQRKVIQIQTEIALDFGVEYAIFWEIYCNVPRVDTDPPVAIDSRNGEQAVSNDQMQGSWLVRADGSFTRGYLYLRGLLGSHGIWRHERCRSGRTYGFDGPCGGVELNVEVQGYPPYLEEGAVTDVLEKIVITGSADGKCYRQLAADCFVTLCHEGFQRLVVINRDPVPNEWRFVRVDFDSGEFRDAEIKIHKPNDRTLKKI
ncbi:hypothetical protein [uncultured Alistipes sp.]|uniref:hypothetical protein n=1 Tax=uncultured Alistipes sp. TaxID=538949 RepID=UPI0025DC2600|nr:hypothetical protein [uncultured Alistipes sp.]